MQKSVKTLISCPLEAAAPVPTTRSQNPRPEGVTVSSHSPTVSPAARAIGCCSTCDTRSAESAAAEASLRLMSLRLDLGVVLGVVLWIWTWFGFGFSVLRRVLMDLGRRWWRERGDEMVAMAWIERFTNGHTSISLPRIIDGYAVCYIPTYFTKKSLLKRKLYPHICFN